MVNDERGAAVGAIANEDHQHTAWPWRQVAVWLVVMAISTLAAYLLWRCDPQVVGENHMIESSQAALLLLACVAYGVRASWKTSEFDTVFRAGLALFCLSLAVRELDIDRFGASSAWLIAERVIRGMVVVAWMVFAVLLWPRLARTLSDWRMAAFSVCGMFTAGGCLLYAFSFPLDKMMLPLSATTAMLLEETLQLNATFLFFAGAVIMTPCQRGRAGLK